MKNIICIPFAFEAEANSGVNIKGDNRKMTYLKNAAVALVSAKWHNPDCTVVFATNIQQAELPEEIAGVLAQAGVETKQIDFNYYRFGKDYTWSLAFYKLCVLRGLIAEGFDYCCYLDTDVYIQSSFDAIWKECERKILLYDVSHGLKVDEYKKISAEMDEFFGEETLATHYGGEFFAANYHMAVEFEHELDRIYTEMRDRAFVTRKGDEFLISVAAERKKLQIKNASPYICRFWTGASFRLISTCYRYNAVDILHLPAEKEKGMVKLFERYIAKGVQPSQRKVWRLCRLSRNYPVAALVIVIRDMLKR